LIKATQDDKSDLVEVLRALTSVNDAGMTDVVILTGNQRGVGAMKVARSMFEVSITAEYLGKKSCGDRPLFISLFFLMKAHSWAQEFNSSTRECLGGFVPMNPWRRECAAALVVINVGSRLSIPTFGTPLGAGL
jgi:hypothetical protein